MGFYNVFLSGFRKVIFPEMVGAFQGFPWTGEWEEIERARVAGYRNASDYAERLLAIYRENQLEPEPAAKQIEKDIMGKMM